MRKTLNTLTAVAGIILVAFSYFHLQKMAFSKQPLEKEMSEKEGESKPLPADWMYNQRAFPHHFIDKQAYRRGIQQMMALQAENVNRNAGEWELAGPITVGGRITDVELHPTNQEIIYAGSASGGLYRTIDGGSNWQEIFSQEGTPSIGNIAVAPSSPNIVYVGTGEPNGNFESGAFFGNGIYKSVNGGDSWTHIGLAESNHIGRIVIDPQNANRVYVAAAGVLYGKNQERGLYRTLDGGQTWERSLYVSDSTACIDVAINPQNADIVYAATWDRIRHPWGRDYGGLTSRIYRSEDGGDTWEQLTNGLPSDSPQRGRIGLTVSKTNPNVVYASYTTNPTTNSFDGIYKSTNGGDSWARVDDGSLDGVFSSFGWYFGNVRVSPTDPDQVWCLGVPLYKSSNGGVTWDFAGGDMHVDFHALEVHPQNDQFMVAGNDGGVYISQNGGIDWQHIETLPITQFYNCEIDNLLPQSVYGGTQDNGTWRTKTGSFDDWEHILGGDGFHVIVDPTDNKYVYAEFQNGNLYGSSDGGQNMNFLFNGGERNNWNTPVVIDPSHPKTLYFGAESLFKTTNRGQNWVQVSPDLTDGQHPSGTSAYGTITSIAVAPNDPNTIYVGTDDGNVQVTFNGGADWTNISNGVPKRFVTEVAVHPDKPLTAYATLSGFRNTDYMPHVLMTTDGGENWQDISGNLPEIPVNDIIVDPAYPDFVLYIANDLGVWFTLDNGVTWNVLGVGLPFVVVNDLVFHKDTRTLLAGTYGASLRKYNASDIMPNAAHEKSQIPVNLEVTPNPLSAQSIISIGASRTLYGRLDVFSTGGKRIATPHNGPLKPGKTSLPLVSADWQPGVYIVRFQTEKGVLAKKVVKTAL